MGAWMKDIRYGWRMLAKTPGFTLLAVITLAVGIAANSTIFSWISSTLLDPIPGASDTPNLVSIMRGDWTENPVPPFSYQDYKDLRDSTHSLTGLLGYHDFAMALTGNTKPERVWGVMASVNYFDVLGVQPILGRGFRPEEDQKPGGSPVVVISYQLWQNRFGADPALVGKSIEINSHLYNVIGIAPPDFRGCKIGLHSDLWIPLMMDPTITGWERIKYRDTYWLQLIGKLKPGTDYRQAQDELNLLMRRLVEQYPQAHEGPNQITLDPLWRSPFGAGYALYTGLSMLLGLAVALLLLSCANVANLLLVRSVERRQEIAIRLSVGANRWQLLRQWFAESLLVAIMGGGLALFFTIWAGNFLNAMIPPTDPPISFETHVDRRVLLATMLVSVTSSVFFGILPALRASGLITTNVLKEESTRSSGNLNKSRLARGLVIGQIALSSLLLICAGLFIRSFQNTQRFYPGFESDHVLLASFDLLPHGYSRQQGIEFYRQLVAKLQALPGVQSATLANWVPLSGRNSTQWVVPQGYVPYAHESMEIQRGNVGPNYLRTLQIPLVAGRDFSPQDTATSQLVAIVNQALVDRYWPQQDPIGRQIQAYSRWFTVVGVFRNIKSHRMNEKAEPTIFLPLSQAYYADPTIFVRVSGNPLSYAGSLEIAVHEFNPDLPLFQVHSLKQAMQVTMVGDRVFGTVTGGIGLLALVLAAVGIYGVVAYATRQRTQEIGIRVALGAGSDAIVRMVMRQGLMLTFVGLAIGLALSLILTHYLQNKLFEVSTTDALTYVLVAGLLSLTGLAACYLPAWRASRLDPLKALHHE
ncbi:MAG TPA: ABC transporter permease [Terriglobia bacterium]|nr:ABC transporter permease [Terriglobia bacterium]